MDKGKFLDTEISVVTDSFDGNIYIDFTRVASDSGETYFRTFSDLSYSVLSNLGLKFRAVNERIYLVLESNYEQFRLNAGDEILFLFNDKTKLAGKFIINSTGPKSSKTNVFSLSTDEVRLFATKHLERWKLINISENIFTVGSLQFEPPDYGWRQHSSTEEAQFLLRYMAAFFLKIYIKKYPTNQIII